MTGGNAWPWPMGTRSQPSNQANTLPSLHPVCIVAPVWFFGCTQQPVASAVLPVAVIASRPVLAGRQSRCKPHAVAERPRAESLRTCPKPAVPGRESSLQLVSNGERNTLLGAKKAVDRDRTGKLQLRGYQVWR